MALILGTEYCKIDSNGRFKFPIALKKQLGTDDCRFVIRQGFTAECLELWTYASFQNEVETLRKELNPYSIRDNQIMRQMTRANLVELDSNDRLMVPPERKSVIGDAKEIVLQSTGKCIEIWERSAYDKMNSEIVDFASIVDQRLGHSAQPQKSMPNDVPCAGDAE
jgi:MraZ protein